MVPMILISSEDYEKAKLLIGRIIDDLDYIEPYTKCNTEYLFAILEKLKELDRLIHPCTDER